MSLASISASKYIEWEILQYFSPRSSNGGAVAEWVRVSTGDRMVDGSSTTSVKTFLFGTLAIPFTLLCQCISDETVKAVCPFYLVSMPGEVKDPTSPHWNV